MKGPPSGHGWRNPVHLGLVVGLAGLVIAGPVGGAIGLLAGGAAATRGVQTVFLAGALALLAIPVFSVIEKRLTESRISDFPLNHPLAEFAARVAAVLLLAGLAGLVARRDRAMTFGVLRPRARESPVAGSDAQGRSAISSTAPLLAVMLIAAFVLCQIGDQRWHVMALALAIVALILAGVLVIAPRLPSQPGR